MGRGRTYEKKDQEMRIKIDYIDVPYILSYSYYTKTRDYPEHYTPLITRDKKKARGMHIRLMEIYLLNEN